MFARGYFPGRSGQIFLVPREGQFITSRDPHYAFMHGSPWDYDTRIPILLYDPAVVRAGAYASPAFQQDVAPTIARILGVDPCATMSGRALEEALAPGAASAPSSKPSIAMLLVLDGMRADYFDTYAHEMPTLARLRREGAWFAQARTDVLPTVTSVGHANIGTGAEPRVHGECSNTLYDRVHARPQNAYDRLDPRELEALTIGDLWNLATDGRAIVLGQGGAIRATAGLVGHGACAVNGKPVIAQSYDEVSGGFETNSECYRMPDALASLNARPYWEKVAGVWKVGNAEHDIASPSKFRASSLFAEFEGDALLRLLRSEPLGADDVADLVLVNLKSPDYVGHAYGPKSEEMRATLATLDAQVRRVVGTLDEKAGAGRWFLAITADHGMPGEPGPNGRRYGEDVEKEIHDRFDAQGKLVSLFADDPADAELYIDERRMRDVGTSLREIAKFLETRDYVAAAFTEDEVRDAQRRLNGIAAAPPPR
jgi:hypothetical protein